MDVNVSNFIEQTAELNRNRDVENAAREKARESRLMKQYGVEVDVPDTSKANAKKRAGKSKDKVADQSWLTKDYMKKKWEEIKKQSAEKEAAKKKEEAKAMEEAKAVMRATMEAKSSKLSAIDQKVSSALTAPAKPKEEKAKETPVVVRNVVERIPKSKAKVLSKKIETEQKAAFHNSFASELGLKSNMSISKLLGKGPKR